MKITAKQVNQFVSLIETIVRTNYPMYTFQSENDANDFVNSKIEDMLCCLKDALNITGQVFECEEESDFSFIFSDDEESDFDDDVDESNYDPYAGCDMYDDYSDGFFSD